MFVNVLSFYLQSDFLLGVLTMVMSIHPLGVANRHERSQRESLDMSSPFVHWREITALLLHCIFFLCTASFAVDEFKQFASVSHSEGGASVSYWSYLKNSVWDFIDIVASIVCLTWLPVALFSSTFVYQRELMTYGILLLSLKFLSFMRGFSTFASLLQMLMMICKDMLPSMVFLLLFTVTFGFAFYAQKGGALLRLDNAMWMSVLLMLGDFDWEEFDTVTMKALWVFYTLVVPIIILNLVIAIMGNSFDKVQETMRNAQLVNLAKLMIEIELMMPTKALNDVKNFPLWVHVLKPADAMSAAVSAGQQMDFSSRVERISNSVEEVISRQIRQVNAKIDTRDEKLLSIEVKMDGMEVKMDGMEEKMKSREENMNTKMDGMEVKMDGMEVKMDGMEEKIDQLMKLMMTLVAAEGSKSK